MQNPKFLTDNRHDSHKSRVLICTNYAPGSNKPIIYRFHVIQPVGMFFEYSVMPITIRLIVLKETVYDVTSWRLHKPQYPDGLVLGKNCSFLVSVGFQIEYWGINMSASLGLNHYHDTNKILSHHQGVYICRNLYCLSWDYADIILLKNFMPSGHIVSI